MKKHFVLFVILMSLVCFCCISCRADAPELERISYIGTPDIRIKNKDTDGSLYLNDETKDYVLSLLNSKEWRSGGTDDAIDYTLSCKILNGVNVDIKYSSETGVFVDGSNNRYVALSDEERETVNSSFVNGVGYKEPKLIRIQYINDKNDSIKVLSDTDEDIILKVLNGRKWASCTASSDSDVVVDLYNNIIYYSTEDGIFNDVRNRRSLDISDDPRLMAEINDIISTAVDLKTLQYQPLYVKVFPERVVLNEESATGVLSVMNGSEWEIGQLKFDKSMFFEMYNARVFYIPYEGVFYDDDNERYLYLTEEQKKYINALLYENGIMGEWYIP